MKAPLSTEESLRRLYARDQGDPPRLLSRIFTAPPAAVSCPRTMEEAAEAVRSAYAASTPITVRGAGSTAFGQSVPSFGGLVLDTGFLRSVRALSANTVNVEAGVRWSDLSAFLAERGNALGSYPSSWFTSVGGWVQTGGCGMLTHRFGPLRNQVTRLRVCAADGKTLDLAEGQADFDAFFQAEGQLGVILAVTLKIRPKPEGEFPLLVTFKELSEAWAFYSKARTEFTALAHASVYNSARMRHLNETFQARRRAKNSTVQLPTLFPDLPTVLLYVETLDAWKALRTWAPGAGGTVAPHHSAAYIWFERFFPLKGKRAEQTFLGNELVVPDAKAAAYTAAIEKLTRMAGVDVCLEANAAGTGESVIIASFYVTGAAAVVGRLPLILCMDRLGVDVHEGRLYNLGAYNSAFAERKFTPEKLAALSAAKGRLDPKGLFNPGKFLDFRTRWTRRMSAEKHRKIAGKMIGLIRKKKWPAVIASRLARLTERGVAAASTPAGLAAELCINCGYCMPVCPAYLVTKDERTTARGKLGLAHVLLRGEKLSARDVELLHSCMHCSACTEVCQSAIDLVPAWRDLETRAAAGGAKPAAAIEAFVKEVEASPDYARLLRRGYAVERGSGEWS